MSLAFLGRSESVPARSPLADVLRASGARWEARDGWEVATRLADAQAEAKARAERVVWADFSHLSKLELQGEAASLRSASSAFAGSSVSSASSASWTSSAPGVWLALTPRRALLLDCPAPPAADGVYVVDVTSQLAAVRIAGPLCRELFARFCSLDLRPQACPPGAVRPGSVARTPGCVLCEGEDRFLMLFGAAYAAYMWEVLSDAGAALGGQPVGVDALEPGGRAGAAVDPVGTVEARDA